MSMLDAGAEELLIVGDDDADGRGSSRLTVGDPRHGVGTPAGRR